jgi:imidazolonepropionase-like amidohydrolase
MVDSHSHITLSGGAYWMERGLDSTETLWRVAEHNAVLLRQAGVRWIRDVGSPPRDGRAVALSIRDAWHGQSGYPYIRAAGSWLTSARALPPQYAIEVESGADLSAAAEQQLDQGADLVKVYMDSPDKDLAPFTVSEVSRAVAKVSARGAKLTAHSSQLAGAKVAAAAGVTSIEHGFQLDQEAVDIMVEKGVWLVSTLAVLASFSTFAMTTRLARFASPPGRAALAAQREWAEYSIQLAQRSGVRIAAGSDFGGGSLRANQLAWEVECLVSAGLSPLQALSSATVNGGELLGEPEAGRLRDGGPADFALVHGDPLTDPAALWRIWRVSW